MLHEFIATNREEIILRCRAKVATRSFPSPTDAEIDHGVPLFLDQLTAVLRIGSHSNPEIGESWPVPHCWRRTRGHSPDRDLVEGGLVVEADRQVLALVIGNLLQNAFKFTRPHTTVTLRADADAERVHIEIEDECGGLPVDNASELFRPFEQRGADRTGLGLGLAFSRWGVEANHGKISVRNMPERGCIFTVDLPRVPVPAAAV